jgi:WD40 repeat protein
MGPHSNQFAVQTPTKGLFIWSLSKAVKFAEIKMHSDKLCEQKDVCVIRVAWSPDSATEGGMIASSCICGDASIWNASTGMKSVQLQGHNGKVRNIAWSPKADRIAGIANDAAIIWSAATGASIHTLGMRGFSSSCVSWSPAGDQLASSGTPAAEPCSRT